MDLSKRLTIKTKKDLYNNVMIIDLKNIPIGEWLTTKKFINLIKSIRPVVQNNFPETIERIFIINAGLVVTLLMKFLSLAIDEKTYKRIVTISDGDLTEIKKVADIKSIPEPIGGKGAMK